MFSGSPGLKAIKKKTVRGSMTVEAAIVLPIFLSIIFIFSYFLKVIHTQSVIGSALNETACEMASAGYVFYISGLRGEMDYIEEGIKKKVNQLVPVKTVLESLPYGDSSLPSFLAEYITGCIDSFMDDKIESAKALTFIPLVRLCMSGYLEADGVKAGERLKSLGIKEGYQGLDFSSSRFLAQDDDIELEVNYTIIIPLPVPLLSRINVTQKSVCRAWMGGDTERAVDEEEDVWSLTNMARGRRIREIFGANLPWGFPGISAFKSGKAILIRSIDLTASSYSTYETVIKTINGYIDDIKYYRGQQTPWGEKGITIMENEISFRELILVVPRKEFIIDFDEVMEECKTYAANNNIILTVKKYGK